MFEIVARGAFERDVSFFASECCFWRRFLYVWYTIRLDGMSRCETS